LVSLAQIQEVPSKNMILLVGPPGAGKSTFCEQVILQNLAIDKPIIYVTTEYDPSKAEVSLREKGLGRIEPGLITFVDAYNETVGLSVQDRPDTIRVDCGNLTSMGIAISKLQERIGKKGVLLVFDSLTSPYLLSGRAVVRFLRLNLSKFAAEGNSVLACFDEGSSKEEDLVGMMSLSNGVIKMELEGEKKVLKVLKHPRVEPTRIEVPVARMEKKIWDPNVWHREAIAGSMKNFKEFRVNLFWPNLMRWSGMLWDPQRFPTMTYEVWKEWATQVRDMVPLLPWHTKLLFKLSIPKNFSKVKDMKKALNVLVRSDLEEQGSGLIEYLENISKTDEHYIRAYEYYECWGFEDIGATLASHIPPILAGLCKGFEKEEREWNAIETKCIGLGDPYCEFKLLPGEIDELRGSLGKDSSLINRIHERLMRSIIEFMLNEKPLVGRHRLGSDFLLTDNPHAVTSERYRMALRMGGAKAGKEIGERLMNAQIGEDEAVKRFLEFLRHCKVGKIVADETIRINESCESRWTKLLKTKLEAASCFFTTGFLNGFFSVVKNQHVKETKCIAMGDPYCEWEF